MPFNYFYKSFLALAFIIIFFSDSYAETANESGNLGCSSGRFENTYYLVPLNAISLADAFFNKTIASFPEQMSGFVGILGNRSIVETYYDFEDLPLLNNGLELYHKINNELPHYREEREKIFLKDNKTNELGYFEVRQYNKKISPIDKHPLLGKIKRKQRSKLFKKLESINVNIPEKITSRIRVEHTDLSFLIRLYDVDVSEISMSMFYIDNFGIPNTSLLLKLELAPERIKYLSDEEDAILANYLCQVSKGFGENLSGVMPVTQFGYAEYNKMADEMLPIRSLFKENPVLFQIGQILVLIVIGFLFIYLLLGRYKPQYKYRTIVRNTVERNSSRN